MPDQKTPETIYLTAFDVEALHVFIMERTGNAPAPVRDRSLLESAVMRPQMAAYYANADLIEQCVLLAVGISQARAFVDGNKRTAFIAADVFLRANGCRFTGGSVETAQQLEAVVAHTGSDEDATARFAEWLRDHVTCQQST